MSGLGVEDSRLESLGVPCKVLAPLGVSTNSESRSKFPENVEVLESLPKAKTKPETPAAAGAVAAANSQLLDTFTWMPLTSFEESLTVPHVKGRVTKDPEDVPKAP